MDRPATATRDRRLDAVVAAIALLLVVGGLARVVAAHREFVAENPQDLLWIALCLVAGTLTFFANGAVALGGRVLLWTGYGTFAMLAGFNLQGLVNGTIVRFVPPAERGLLTYLVLGVGAGVCQTAGKWLMIAVLNRVHQPRTRHDVLAAGLAVGLGFGLSEVVFIGGQVIAAETAVTGLGVLGIWERMAAVAFHVYTSGLIAIALARRTAWPVALVVAVHSFEDWLAGAVGTRVIAIPAVQLESIYTVSTLVVWAVYRRAAAALRDAAPPP